MEMTKDLAFLTRSRKEGLRRGRKMSCLSIFLEFFGLCIQILGFLFCLGFGFLGFLSRRILLGKGLRKGRMGSRLGSQGLFLEVPSHLLGLEDLFVEILRVDVPGGLN
jgi:hypothetical protein